jgi:hypothetical protein
MTLERHGEMTLSTLAARPGLAATHPNGWELLVAGELAAAGDDRSDVAALVAAGWRRAAAT